MSLPIVPMPLRLRDSATAAEFAGLPRFPLDGPVPPPALDEGVIDDLVGYVRGVIAARRDPCYGSLRITDDQVRELANAIVTGVTLGYRVERLP